MYNSLSFTGLQVGDHGVIHVKILIVARFPLVFIFASQLATLHQLSRHLFPRQAEKNLASDSASQIVTAVRPRPRSSYLCEVLLRYQLFGEVARGGGGRVLCLSRWAGKNARFVWLQKDIQWLPHSQRLLWFGGDIFEQNVRSTANNLEGSFGDNNEEDFEAILQIYYWFFNKSKQLL